MKLPQINIDGLEFCEENEHEYESEQDTTNNTFQVKFGRKLHFNENFLLMQYFWRLCGLGFHQQEAYLLSLTLQNLQQHPAVSNCRFWGKIFGLKKSYFIAEVDLTEEEIKKREKLMLEEINEKIAWYSQSQDVETTITPDISLTPGYNFRLYPSEELAKMTPVAVGIPISQFIPTFDIPPEIIGTALNRKSYFVINDPTDNWIELPIVTPKQIDVCRKIKKYFTGDLESEIFSFPLFPGREKHLLRATIARITSGTYIAPTGYYRKQTKRDLGLQLGVEEEEEEFDEEDEELDNDVVILNEDYKPHNLQDLKHPLNWVHVRPNILPQGRIKFFNMAKELKEFQRQQRLLEGYEEEEQMEEEEEIDEEEEPPPGPALLDSIANDKTTENIYNWTLRFSSIHNQMNRMVLVKSNLWPGSFTFSYENFTDSIYIGWGQKYISRNYSPIHLPHIQEEYPHDVTITEILDPTPEDEELYRLSKLKPDLHLENLSTENNELEEEDDDED